MPSIRNATPAASANSFRLFQEVGGTPSTPETRGRQDASRKDRRLAVLVAAVGAIVLLEGFLREAIESECGCGAFETRGGDAQGAVGAAPADEVVISDPDQAFTHISPTFACVWVWSSAATGGTHQCVERGRWTPARRRRLFST